VAEARRAWGKDSLAQRHENKEAIIKYVDFRMLYKLDYKALATWEPPGPLREETPSRHNVFEERHEKRAGKMRPDSSRKKRESGHTARKWTGPKSDEALSGVKEK